MYATRSFELTHVDMERVVYMQHASLPLDFDALVFVAMVGVSGAVRSVRRSPPVVPLFQSAYQR